MEIDPLYDFYFNAKSMLGDLSYTMQLDSQLLSKNFLENFSDKTFQVKFLKRVCVCIYIHIPLKTVYLKNLD